MSTQASSKSAKFYIHMAIVLVLMFGIGYLPPIGAITPFGMKVLGVFIGSLVGWALGYTGWVSLTGLVALGVMSADPTNANTVLAAAFGNANLLVVLFGFMFCYGLAETGIVQFIANLILSRKFATKGPWMVSLAFWIASAVASGLIGVPVTGMILCWTLFYAVAESAGMEKKSKWVAITLVTMCVTCLAGSLIMPYYVWNIMCYAMASAALPGFQVNYVAHFVLYLVINIALIVLLFIVCRFIIGRDVKFDRDIDHIVDPSSLKLSKRAAWGLFFLILLGVLMFVPSLLPKDLAIVAILNKIGMCGPFIVCMVLMVFVRVDGKPLMSIEDSIKETPWSMFLLLLSALYLATIMATPEVGISATLVELVGGALGGLPLFAVMALLLVLGILATNLINNLVCLNVFGPIGLGLVAAMGGSVGAMAALFAIGLYLGIIFPSGSAIGAVAHGNTEWLESKQVYLYGTLDIVVITIVLVFLGIPLGTMLFG